MAMYIHIQNINLCKSTTLLDTKHICTCIYCVHMPIADVMQYLLENFRLHKTLA